MRAAYLLVLLAVVAATLPLELLLGARVYRRPLRWVLTIAPVLVVFAGWDVWAIHAGHWRYDPRQLVGLTLPGRLPLEEALFFVVVPTAAILTLEAVRIRRPHWRIGDEPAERR